jgi:hypothetical protein
MKFPPYVLCHNGVWCADFSAIWHTLALRKDPFGIGGFQQSPYNIILQDVASAILFGTPPAILPPQKVTLANLL